ncbi:MAG: hypothetical protein QOJ65_2838 [Fimbriimonadaceae bacterium]|jgi:Tol biopolymer transport system component|nr:hypothetical protein [Fimbriimonadaceae bacterium]
MTDLRYVDPNGGNDTLLGTSDQQYSAATPNPNVQNQVVFAYTTNANPGSDPNATYALYRNTSVSIIGATRITDPVTLPLNFVGTIQFSPNGQKIVFTGTRGSDHAIYVMDANGGNLVRLISGDDAQLSPDGTKILYSQSQGNQADLFWIGLNETTGHPILATTDQDEIMPQWSKNGQKIVFSSKPTASLTAPFDVYVITFGSATAPIQLTSNGDNNFSPTFSADNAQVGYARLSFTNVALSGIYRTPASGGAETAIVLNPSVQPSVYWTSTNGRAYGGVEIAMGRSLRKFKLGNR